MKSHTKALICMLMLMGGADGAIAQSADRPRPQPTHRHFGIPIFGPNCVYRLASPYCDYSYYQGPIFIDGAWVYGSRYPHRVWNGRHQFWYRGGWHDGAWGHGGHWGGMADIMVVIRTGEEIALQEDAVFASPEARPRRM